MSDGEIDRPSHRIKHIVVA